MKLFLISFFCFIISNVEICATGGDKKLHSHEHYSNNIDNALERAIEVDFAPSIIAQGYDSATNKYYTVITIPNNDQHPANKLAVNNEVDMKSLRHRKNVSNSPVTSNNNKYQAHMLSVVDKIKEELQGKDENGLTAYMQSIVHSFSQQPIRPDYIVIDVRNRENLRCAFVHDDRVKKNQPIECKSAFEYHMKIILASFFGLSIVMYGGFVLVWMLCIMTQNNTLNQMCHDTMPQWIYS